MSPPDTKADAEKGRLNVTVRHVGDQTITQCDGCHAMRVDGHPTREGWLVGPEITLCSGCRIELDKSTVAAPPDTKATKENL